MSSSKALTRSMLDMQDSIVTTSITSNITLVSEVYQKLLRMVTDSPESHRQQLKSFNYPMFAFLYLEMLSQGHGAAQFCNEFQDVFAYTTNYIQKAMKELMKVKSIEDVNKHPNLNLFWKNKYSVRLTEDCFYYLLDFLKEDHTNILIDLINLHFCIAIKQSDDDESLVEQIIRAQVPRKKPSRKTVDKSPVKTQARKRSKRSTKNSSKAENDTIDTNNDSFSTNTEDYMNAEPLDKQENSEDGCRKKIQLIHEETTAPETETELLNASKLSENDATVVKNFTVIHPKAIKPGNEISEDISRKIASLKTAMEKVSDLSPYVPLVRSYDVSNFSHRSLCNVKISWDEELLASAFDNSSIELCSLTPTPLHIDPKSGGASAVELHYVEQPDTECSLRQVHTLRAHSGPVYGLSFNRESNILLSCSRDTTIRAWDMKDYKNKAVYRGHTYPVFDIDFDLFSFRFASASLDGVSRLWDTERAYPLSMLVGHNSGVNCVKFHPNGKYLATGSYDTSVILWHSQESREMRIFHGHKASVMSLAFSICGKYLASAGVDKIIKIWDIRSGKSLCDLEGHDAAIHSLCFNSDSSILASGGQERNIRFWNMEDLISKKLPVKKAAAGETDPYLLASVPTQGSTVQFVRFGRKNLLTSVGLSANCIA